LLCWIVHLPAPTFGLLPVQVAPLAAAYPAPRADQSYESPICAGLLEFGGSRSAEFLLQNSTNQSAPCAQFKPHVYMFKRTLTRTSQMTSTGHFGSACRKARP